MISFHSFHILCLVSGVTLDLKKMAKDRVRLSKVTICAVGMGILLLLIKSFLFVSKTAIPIHIYPLKFFPLPFGKSSFKYSTPLRPYLGCWDTTRRRKDLCFSRGVSCRSLKSSNTKGSALRNHFQWSFLSWKSSNSKDSAKQSHFHFHCMKLSARTQKVQLCTFLPTVLA